MFTIKNNTKRTMLQFLLEELLIHITQYLTTHDLLNKFNLVNQNCHLLIVDNNHVVWMQQERTMITVTFENYESMIPFLLRYRPSKLKLQSLSGEQYNQVFGIIQSNVIEMEIVSYTTEVLKEEHFGTLIFPKLKSVKMYGVPHCLLEKAVHLENIQLFCIGTFPIRQFIGLHQLKSLTVTSELKLREIESIVCNLKLQKLSLVSDINLIDFVSRVCHSRCADYLESLTLLYTGDFENVATKSVLQGVTDRNTESNMKLKELITNYLPVSIATSIASHNSKTLEHFVLNSSTEFDNAHYTICYLPQLKQLTMSDVPVEFTSKFLVKNFTITDLTLSEVTFSIINEEDITTVDISSDILTSSLRNVSLENCSSELIVNILHSLDRNVNTLSVRNCQLPIPVIQTRTRYIQNYRGPYELLYTMYQAAVATNHSSTDEKLVVKNISISPTIFDQAYISCCEMFIKTESLTVLYSDNISTDVLENISSFHSLRQLDIYFSSIHAIVIPALSNSNQQLSQLTKLHLTSFKSVYPYISQLRDYLPVVEQLQVSINIEEVSSILKLNWDTLQTLDMVILGCNSGHIEFTPVPDHITNGSIVYKEQISFEDGLTLLLCLPPKDNSFKLHVELQPIHSTNFAYQQTPSSDLNQATEWLISQIHTCCDRISHLDTQQKQSIINHATKFTGVFASMLYLCMTDTAGKRSHRPRWY
jgi:hypothetical protein